MIETSCQNPSTQTSQSYDSSFNRSSKQFTAATPEMFQNREVLLKMLQPPVLYLSSSSCSLPYHEEAKKCSSSDRSHCFRCINCKPLHNLAPAVTTETTEDWIRKTTNGFCSPQPNIRDQKNICHRQTEEKIVQSPRDLESDINLARHRDLLKKRPFEKTSLLFPTTTFCPTCKSSTQTFPHEQFRLRTAHCPRVLPDGQKHINTGDCFQKETLPKDRSWALEYQGRQIENITLEKLSKRSPRKDDNSLKQGFLPSRCYHGRVMQADQASASSRTTVQEHQDKETTSVEVLDDDQPVESRINGLSQCLHRSSLANSFVTTQDNHNELSLAVPQGPGFGPSRPSEGSLEYQDHEERNNRLAEASKKQNDACPCCPDESSQEECIPVIVHCYSLSEPCSRGDSQKMQGYTVSKDGSWLPHRQTQCLRQEPPLNRCRSVKRLRGDENVQNDTMAFFTGSNPYAQNQRLSSQPKNVSNEHLSKHVAVENERQQNSNGFMSPNHVYTKFSPPAKCHCPNCPTYRCTQEIEQINSSCNEKFPEVGDIPKSSSLVHIPSGPQKTHVQDRQTDVESEPESLYHYKQLINSQRAYVRDYYEERRILVEQFYPNMPGSGEDAQSVERSHIPYAFKRDGYNENHHRRHPPSADVFQNPLFENTVFRTRVRQEDFVAESKKSKNRQSRPQKVRDDDPSQLEGNEGEQVHYEDNRLEEPCENRSHPQAILSSHHDTSISTKTSPCNDTLPRVPAHLGWIRRCDDNFINNTTSRLQICRSVTPADTKPRCHPSSKGRRSSEISRPLFETQRVQTRNVPSFDDISNEHSPSNQFPMEHERSAYHQFKTPHRNIEISHLNDTKRPGYLRSEWKIDPQYCFVPTELEVSKIHFETLEKRRASLESVHKIRPPPLQVAFGPSQFNIARQGGEMDSENPCNDEAMPDYVERRAVPAIERNKKEHSHSPSSSLSNDQDSVTSTTLDDGEAIQKTQISERPLQVDEDHTIIDGESPKNHTEEQHVTFSESRNLFLKRQEVYGNFMSSSVKERRFVCRFCCKKFAHFSTLQNHVRTHTGDKPFQCKFCSRRFAQSGVLKAHLRTHTGDKPFVCMYCGKMFAQSTTLTNHLRTHTGQKPYECHYCGKSFSQPSTLRKHELSHTKERPYSCKFCGKAFAQQSTLTNHIRSHTGQRPYKCHFCEKSFAQLSTLDRHLRLHSSMSFKPHQCQYCNKSFSYFSNLATHMQIHEQGQLKTEERSTRSQQEELKENGILFSESASE